MGVPRLSPGVKESLGMPQNDSAFPVKLRWASAARWRTSPVSQQGKTGDPVYITRNLPKTTFFSIFHPSANIWAVWSSKYKEHGSFLVAEKNGSLRTLENPVQTRGWSLKGQERKKKEIWTARQVNHDLTSRICCYQCSTLFNYDRYFCTGAFFVLIEWLKDYILDLYLYLIFWMSTIFRFWICWGW